MKKNHKNSIISIVLIAVFVLFFIYPKTFFIPTLGIISIIPYALLFILIVRVIIEKLYFFFFPKPPSTTIRIDEPPTTPHQPTPRKNTTRKPQEQATHNTPPKNAPLPPKTTTKPTPSPVNQRKFLAEHDRWLAEKRSAPPPTPESNAPSANTAPPKPNQYTPAELGKMYERYIGYQYWQKGYDVEYHGINKGLEDLGIDLICRNGRDTILVQTKYWAAHNPVRENTVFQLYGAARYWQALYPDQNISATIVTSSGFSEQARAAARVLCITLQAGNKYNPNYPTVKCIRASNGSRQYRLPEDSDYDSFPRPITYLHDTASAENQGFTRNG